MRELSEVEQAELLNIIRAKTGCAALCLITADSPLPCPDAMSGVKCAHPHRYSVVVANIQPLSAIECIIGCTGASAKELALEILEQHGEEDPN